MVSEAVEKDKRNDLSSNLVEKLINTTGIGIAVPVIRTSSIPEVPDDATGLAFTAVLLDFTQRIVIDDLFAALAPRETEERTPVVKLFATVIVETVVKPEPESTCSVKFAGPVFEDLWVEDNVIVS